MKDPIEVIPVLGGPLDGTMTTCKYRTGFLLNDLTTGKYYVYTQSPDVDYHCDDAEGKPSSEDELEDGVANGYEVIPYRSPPQEEG